MGKQGVRRRQVKPAKRRKEPLNSEGRNSSKLSKLKSEYDELKKERAGPREEINELDRKLATGAITDRQRDKEFRLKLVRAGELSRRIVQVIGEMAKLGRVPEDYQA